LIFGHIDNPITYQPLLKNKIWLEALEWIKNNVDNTSGGIYELHGKDMYVNVHDYETLPLKSCRFESHRRYIDLQYCISGGEKIAWKPVADLKKDGEYDEKKDFQFYLSDIPGNILTFVPGTFGIFFPEDGHQPKVFDGGNTRVKKLVFKVNNIFLNSQKTF